MRKLLSNLCLLLLSGVVSAQSNPAQSSVTVIATDTSLTWKWAPVVGATSYSIWMVDGSSGTYAQTWIRVARITTASYALTGLAPGTAVTRRVSTNENGMLTFNPATYNYVATVLSGTSTIPLFSSQFTDNLPIHKQCGIGACFDVPVSDGKGTLGLKVSFDWRNGSGYFITPDKAVHSGITWIETPVTPTISAYTSTFDGWTATQVIEREKPSRTWKYYVKSGTVVR